MSFVKIILVCSAFLAFSSPLMAADKPADNMQILLEKVKADKKLFMAENMQLTDKEAKTFWPLYENYQSELFLIRMRTANLIKSYTDSHEKMTDSIAAKLLDDGLEIESLRLKLSKAYLPKFRKILPATKVVRYYQMESKVNAILYYELAVSIPLMDVEKPAAKGEQQ